MSVLYSPTTWRKIWHQPGEFEPGRPFLLVHLERRSDGAPLWVMANHLPHMHPQLGLQSAERPDRVISRALSSAAATTRRAVEPLLVLGDFNEYGELGLDSADGLGTLKSTHPSLRELTERSAVTCCTKWAEGLADWRHKFDHIYATFTPSRPPAFIPYSYPGVAPHSECATPACTGQTPPSALALPTGNTRPSVGSWHRGYEFAFELPRDRE